MLPAIEIDRLCRGGLLFPVELDDWRAIQKRSIYVTRDVHRFITEPSKSAQTNIERRTLLALFERFVSGATMTVAFDPKIEGSDLKRLSPKTAEVWEFKVRPKRYKQLRVFGRFASPDIMIVLTGPVSRRGVDFQKEKLRCQQEWRVICGDHSPVVGRKLSDYFTEPNIVALGNP